MAKLTFDKVRKEFDGKLVLKDVSIDIGDGELIALLGPSGCGKTTMLRLAAGFEKPEEGEISMGAQTLSSPDLFIEPEKRNMGIVFQSYALWPNMNVRENVAYPLKLRKIGSAEINKQTDMALETVSLTRFADMPPASLSGGQRQRVALARCLVMQPAAVLLDEPLANLDAHLRDHMQKTFVEFHKTTGSTMIYVTHDQAEAMAMADRIAVMFDGEIVQCDRPQALYDKPANEKVARFIGQGSIVTLTVEQLDPNSPIGCLLDGRVPFHFPTDWTDLRQGAHVRACVRPEHVHISEATSTPSPGHLLTKVISSTFLGERYRLRLSLENGEHLLAYDHVPRAVGDRLTISISRAWAFSKELR